MLPGRFIGIDGLGALEAGQMMIPLAIPLLVAVGLARLGRALDEGAGPTLVMPMALIGVGIGLPWGLMDSMAVSVVEKERAGMATGIFNAVRVSADGVAIAIAGALLAILIQGGLLGALSAVDPATVIEVANRAALGDLNQSTALLPGKHSLTLTTYDNTFRFVLYVLAASSALTAILVFALLGRSRDHLQSFNLWKSRPPTSEVNEGKRHAKHGALRA